MSGDRDLVRWALAAPIASTRHIGADKVRLVLTALATHANADCLAWPSAKTLAAEVHGLAVRDVRNALATLEVAELIERVAGGQGRVGRYRLLAPDFAGSPANSQTRHLAGIPANDLAGNFAGNFAGIPAPNGNGRTTSTREDTMTDPIDVAAAVFGSSHPGREREAVERARVLLQNLKGGAPTYDDVRRYYGSPRWTDAELRRKVQLAAPSRQPCSTCDGGGFLLGSNETDLNTFGRPVAPCPECKQQHRKQHSRSAIAGAA